MSSGGLRNKNIFKASELNRPFITVVTVVRNGEDRLEETIVSVINQTYDNFEYIIIDGESTDKTIDIIKKYEDKIDYWISEPDDGMPEAMNKGLDLARGDWLIFIQCGDKFLINTVLDTAVQKMDEKDSVYYGDVYLTDSRKIYAGRFSHIKLGRKNICHQAIFYPMNIFKKYKYSSKYSFFSDYHYNIFIFKKADFVYLNETIAIYEGGGGSVIYKDQEFDKEKYQLVIKNLGIISFVCRILYGMLYKTIFKYFIK